MKSLEIKAKTVEEAIQQALDQLGVSREEVKVTVLNEGRQGVLGLGADDAKVRVELLMPMAEEENTVSEMVIDILEALLSMLGVDASVMTQAGDAVEGEQDTIAPRTFEIKGDDLGILIGRRGQTLACLQYIVRLMVSHKTKTWDPIIIDVEGYKERRYEALRNLALRIAEQVKTRKVPFTLEPMPANERRIAHLTLADHPDVTTQSIGEGEARKVVILLREK